MSKETRSVPRSPTSSRPKGDGGRSPFEVYVNSTFRDDSRECDISHHRSLDHGWPPVDQNSGHQWMSLRDKSPVSSLVRQDEMTSKSCLLSGCPTIFYQLQHWRVLLHWRWTGGWTIRSVTTTPSSDHPTSHQMWRLSPAH